MRSRLALLARRGLSLLALLCSAAALAYPGADAGPAPWKPARGKPAPLAGLALLPPPAVWQALKAAGVPSSSLGLYVRRVDAARPLVALNQEQPFVLASTAKLVTSLAALDLLGPDYRWSTQAVAQGDIVDGRLDGNLLIVGGGDAMLQSDALRQWFAALHAQGLHEIAGDIVLDRLAFSLAAEDLARTPRPEPQRPYHVWPDALPLDAGVLRVEVLPQPKGRAQLRMQPVLAGVQLVGAFSADLGCAAHATLAPASTDGASRTLAVAAGSSGACGVQQVALVPMSHAEFSTRAVAALWAESGGSLRGRVVDRAAPAASAASSAAVAEGEPPPAFAVHRSEPLPRLLREMNKPSDNLLARNLMLSMSPGFPQQPATADAARGRVQQWLKTQGLRDDDIEVDSGSGLSRLERGKPRALAQLLARAWSGRHARALVDSLPIAGVDGTLAQRFVGTAAAGQAFLKTGSLLDARALAGYVRGRSGKVYAVAAMINHPEAAAATPALDALIEWLASEG